MHMRDNFSELYVIVNAMSEKHQDVATLFVVHDGDLRMNKTPRSLSVSRTRVFFFPSIVCLSKSRIPLECVDKIVWSDYSNESYWVLLSCGSVYYTVQDDSSF